MHAFSSRAIVLSLVGLALAACGSDSTGTGSGGSGGWWLLARMAGWSGQ
jgi:hypothetical protein